MEPTTSRRRLRLSQHTFTAPYSGQVGLRVTDNDGLTSTAFADVDVTEPPTPTPTATATPPAFKCADVNGDGRVDLRDVGQVLVHVFRRYDARYDLNNDHRVNLIDVIIAIFELGRRC